MKAFGFNAKQIIERFSQVSVAVLGDLICDRFVYGEVERISPEAPVPVVKVTSEELKVGGAGNVANNLVSLGGRASVFGVVGKDSFGDFVRSELKRIGADTCGIVADESRMTTLKTRIMARSQHIVRVDREITDPVRAEVESEILGKLWNGLESAEVLVISDYAKGVLTPRIARRAIEGFTSRGRWVICDPKPNNLWLFEGVDLITPNKEEALRSAGAISPDEDPLFACATKLRQQLKTKAVMITAGADGIYLLDDSGFHHVRGQSVEVYDVVGAGDTVTAATALALGAGADFLTAVKIANVAGGIVVGKLGLATVSKSELLERIS